MNHGPLAPEFARKPADNGLYDPALLLNELRERMNFSRDSQLAHYLNIERRLLGKIRTREANITGSMLIIIQDATGISVTELKKMLKDRRKTSRMGSSSNPLDGSVARGK